MNLIIINGYPRSGKDTFASMCLAHYLCTKGIIYSSVDTVKLAASIIGWDGVKDAKGRKFLSDIKDLATEYGDLTIKELLELVKKDYSHIFAMVREPSEIEKIKNIFPNVITVCLSSRFEEKHENTGDSFVKNQTYDVYITNNDSLRELRTAAHSLMLELELRRSI